MEGHTENFGPVTESCGTFGVSNHPQHQPYRKSDWGRERMASLLEDSQMVSRLEELMGDRTLHWPDSQIIRQSECSERQAVLLPFFNYQKSLHFLL